MKDVPEIAPEIRGLLEEIVADPRSSMRLAPRRALRSWFESGSGVRPSEVSGTKVERHLVAVHREALAQLLYEAAKIAFWKGPLVAVRPVGPDGTPYDPAERERAWIQRTKASLDAGGPASSEMALLEQCLEGVTVSSGFALAAASLSLSPRAETRLCLACHAMRTSLRWALSLFGRTAALTTSAHTRGVAWSQFGNCALALDRAADAREAYLKSCREWPMAGFSLLNLALVEGTKVDAASCAMELDERDLPESSISDACAIIRQWAKTRPQREILTARETLEHLDPGASKTARRVKESYD